MKKIITSFALVLALSVFCAIAAVADNHKSATFTLSGDANINTTSMRKGEYKIRFYDDTNKVEVLKDNEIVLTTTGRVVEETNKAENNALLTTTTDNGMLVTGIRYKGERRTIMFTEPVAAETRSQD